MKLTFRVHAIRRMRQWQITAEEVRHVLKTEEIVERYPEDRPITVYEPDPRLWNPTFRTRRRPPK